MREGILDQLPQTLAKNDSVVVFGPSDYPGQNSIKRLINELNRKEPWIRNVFRNQISADKVSSNAKVVLTMRGVNHCVLNTVRRVAGLQNVCCPNQELKPGEVKDILRFLADRRGEVMPIPVPHNGNGNHQPNEVDFTQSDPVLAAPAPAPDTEIPSEAQLAITAIEKLQSAAEETQIALLVITDELKAGSAGRDEFLKQLAEKDAKIAELQTELAAAAKIAEEKEILRKKNDGLESEVRRLRNTIEKFDQLIKGTRKP